MDIRCGKCGEPWDTDCLHEEIAERLRYGGEFRLADGSFKRFRLRFDRLSYGERTREQRDAHNKDYAKIWEAMRAEFRRDGCAALVSYGAHCEAALPAAHRETLAMISDLAGGDVDFEADLLEDAEQFGLFS